MTRQSYEQDGESTIGITYMVDNIDSKNRMTGLKDKIENKCSKSNWPATFCYTNIIEIILKDSELLPSFMFTILLLFFS